MPVDRRLVGYKSPRFRAFLGGFRRHPLYLCTVRTFFLDSAIFSRVAADILSPLVILAQVFEPTLPRASHNVAGGSARILLPANYTLFIIFFFHASFSARSRSDPSRNSPSSSILQYSSAYSSANMYPPDLRYEQLYLASSAFAKSYWSPVQRFSSSGLAFSPQMQSPSVKLLNCFLDVAAYSMLLKL